MVASRSHHGFRIEVRASAETNDHEGRCVAEGEDLIGRFWDDMMGLDPDDILVEPCPLRAGTEPRRATVARCSCGVVGCGSIEIEISRFPAHVEWRWGSPEATQLL